MKLLLAPMATVSHEAFRRAVARFGGCDEYFNEMINASSLMAGGHFEKFYVLAETEPEKLVWQLTGNKAQSMAEAASVLATYSGLGVDLNMGCSAPQIANTGAGVAWMLKPLAETRDMVRLVKTALSNVAKDGRAEKRLSVKLRLGAEDFTEEGLFAFCDMLVSEGVEMLTLHPRTKKEKYRLPPRWEYVERLALRYKDRVPVILNGNVSDSKSFLAAVKAAPHAAGVMVARAAAQKPWLFAVLAATCKKCTSLDAAPSASEAPAAPSEEPLVIDCEQLALDFIDDVARFQPPEFYKTRLQRFFAYYCDNFSFAHYFKTQMLNAANAATPEATLESCKAQVRAYFAQCADDKTLVVAL